MDGATLDNAAVDEPFEDWIDEWWENGPKQWWAASLAGRAHGPFQAWILGWREGRIEGTQKVLLVAGKARLGLPDDAIRSQIEVIADLDTLDRLIDRLLTVSSWTELLAGEKREVLDE